MDDKILREIILVFGNKIYELQLGYAALFNQCMKRGVFTETAFHQERLSLESLPDFQQFHLALTRLSESEEQADLESFLKTYKGPVQ